MKGIRLTDVEMKFAEILWENEPLTHKRMLELAEERLDWKKSTVYSTLRLLCYKGIFLNENRLVTALISKEDYQLRLGEDYLKEIYGGSFLDFAVAFTKKNKLSEEEAKELMQIARESIPETGEKPKKKEKKGRGK